LVTACAHRSAEFSPRKAVESIAATSAAVKTVRGKAWISVKTPEGAVAFPANVAIDRTRAGHSLLRLEAVDLVGTTHAMMLLNETGRFLWVDFDRRSYFEVTKTWYGLPVREFPGLLLGLPQLPSDGRVSAHGDLGFQVSTGGSAASSGNVLIEMQWVDPGPRLFAKSVSSPGLGYSVEYSAYQDTKDFYLPAKVGLSGKNIQIQLDWREQIWNEPIDATVFSSAALERALKKFRKVRQ